MRGALFHRSRVNAYVVDNIAHSLWPRNHPVMDTLRFVGFGASGYTCSINLVGLFRDCILLLLDSVISCF